MEKLLTKSVFVTAGAILLATFGEPAAAQTFWTGPTTTFTKMDFADWTLEENQDRLTDNVWITRQNQAGLFNIAQEPSSNGFGTTGTSPIDTEWAFGSIADDVTTLTFTSWNSWAGGSPPSTVGRDAVLHLISNDIYVDLMFTSWTGGGAGGGFSYERSTPVSSTPVPEPTFVLGFLALGTLGAASTLLRKLKLSKFTEKELEKVS